MRRQSYARWRNLCAQVDTGEPIDQRDAVWLISLCRDVLDGGRPLKTAFGLPARGGVRGLAQVATLEHRDVALRAVAREHFASLEPCAAARAMLSAIDRARSPRSKKACPEDASIRRLLAGFEVPGEKQIARILRDKE